MSLDTLHGMTEEKKTLLEVRDLKMHFPVEEGVLKRRTRYVKAVDGVSFDILEGETLALVGESGCGKTSTGRCILRITDPTDGEISYTSREANVLELTELSNDQLKPLRKEIRMVFQDPQSSLNPRLPVVEIIGQCIRDQVKSQKELEDRVADLLHTVGLRPEYLHRYPHAFSGGERQRIGIARAIATNPRLVVADEAVSALDVSVQAATLNLMQNLQRQMGLTYLFVAHDLSVVEHIADRVAVMYCGRIVELAATEELFETPKHPYTEALLSAVPIPDPDTEKRRNRIHLPGEAADPANPPKGCHFNPRCRFATELCQTETPTLQTLPSGRRVACHFANDLSLSGVHDIAANDERTP